MVPEIWCVTENFLLFWTKFCPFTPLTIWKIKILWKWKNTPGDITILHMCTINDNHIMYGSSEMECDRHNFLSFSTIVCHFNPTNNQENQNFEKMKKTPGDIITLQMRTINDNYMMYGSWYKEYKGQKFLSFWIIFWSFTPLTTRKINIFKIWKNCLELSSFYKSIPKIMIICYTVIEIWHVTDVVFIFWTFTNSNNK